VVLGSEAPSFYKDGQAVKGVLTPQMEAMQRTRIDAEAEADETETGQEGVHNEAELASFYRKYDRARVGQVHTVLQHYTLEHIAGLCMLRYG
jgi:hypothetical protein